MQYYLIHLGSGNYRLVSGDSRNWASFSVYDPATKSWDCRFGAFWADKIFVDGFTDFEEISSIKAEQFINAYH